MTNLYLNSFRDSKDVLLEDCLAGDESLQLIDVDAEDFAVLQLLVAMQSLRVSRALGALYANAYARGRRDARRCTSSLAPAVASPARKG